LQYPKEIGKSTEDYDKHRFEVYRNNMLGLDEMLKKLWTIADPPKTDSKEKIKAIVLIGQYLERYCSLLEMNHVLLSQ